MSRAYSEIAFGRSCAVLGHVRLVTGNASARRDEKQCCYGCFLFPWGPHD